MRMVVIAAAAALGLVPAAGFAEDAKVEKGMQVFAAQKCSLCHSIAGKGNAKGSLDGVGSKLSAAEIKQQFLESEESSGSTSGRTASMIDRRAARTKPPSSPIGPSA